MDKTISIRYLTNVKRQIKRESYHWFSDIRDNTSNFPTMPKSKQHVEGKYENLNSGSQEAQ